MERLFINCFQIELEFSSGFCEGRKTQEPRKTLGARQEPTVNSTLLGCQK